jgi:exosortase C (VPDSG-CTERM-specific)
LGTICFGVLVLAFAPTLVALAIHVAHSQLHSYILLIPPLSFYLIYIRRDQLPKVYSTSAGLGLMASIAGFAALALANLPGTPIQPLSPNDYLGVLTLSFLLLLVAGGFFFLGQRWMVAAAFPVLFLFFMIPMPDAMVDGLETASKLGSAETASLFFSLSGTPFLRAGTVFQLPNITLQVAQECSGIRSSWILLITSLVASNLFLHTTWRRLVLVAFVIPLGLLRNGFRILVIGLLCVNYGPQMINSVIHRRGGPVFFALSLIPLFLLLWWLRSGEREKASGRAESPSERETGRN